MQITAPMAGYTYAQGEEVVARLQGCEAHAVEDGALLAPPLLPDWTIGEVTDRVELDGALHYVLRFLHRGANYVALVRDGMIEGTA